LSVEEQFYLCIPLFCATIWRVRRRLLAPALTLLACISFAGSVYAVAVGEQSNAFYFLHFRAWELLAGSLLALLPSGYKVVGGEPPRNSPPLPIHIKPAAEKQANETSAAPQIQQTLAAAFGLFLVLATYAVVSSTTPFPGATALAPVIGTTLLIRYGRSGWVSQLLSCRPFVLTGKISYSLYLWHWPVIVFWKYAVYDDLRFYDYIGMFLLSFLLGYLSWRFVELPVRTSPAWTMRRSFGFAAIGIACLFTLGTACQYYRGWPTILHPSANEVAYVPPPRDPFWKVKIIETLRRIGSAAGHEFEAVVDYDARVNFAISADGGDRSASIGASGEPQIFLLGDSHAGSVRYGLDALLRERRCAGYAVCRSNSDMFDLELPEVQIALKELSQMPTASQVLLVELWAKGWFPEDGRPRVPRDYVKMYARLEEFALYIKSMKRTLFIATDIPSYPQAPADIEARARIIVPRRANVLVDSEQQSADDYDRVQREINLSLQEICKKTGAVLIPLHLAFKQDDHYVSYEIQRGKTVPLYRDQGHLTAAGSLRAARFIMPVLYSKGRE
jgi:hypothetical protein